MPDPKRQNGVRGSLLWRVLLLAAVFVGVAFATSHALIAHAVAHGAREYNVRLAGMMGGLFAGGVITLALGLALLFPRRKHHPGNDPR